MTEGTKISFERATTTGLKKDEGFEFGCMVACEFDEYDLGIKEWAVFHKSLGVIIPGFRNLTREGAIEGAKRLGTDIRWNKLRKKSTSLEAVNWGGTKNKQAIIAHVREVAKEMGLRHD